MRGRNRVRSRNDSVKLSPDEEHGNLELAEAVDEDEVLSVTGERARPYGLDRRVCAGHAAGGVHVVDAAIEDEAALLEKEFQQPPGLVSGRLGFDPIEQLAADLWPESGAIDEHERTDELGTVERELKRRCAASVESLA